MFKIKEEILKKLRPAGLAAAALVLGLLCLSAAGKKKAKDYFPVDDVKAGMKGYGLTVFSGREPEKFDVEVISVIKNFLPKQDVILARCSHPVLDHAGVIAGMSGSPIFFEGKFAGAVAYAWRFSKDPIAGITPAEYMLEYLSAPELPKKAKTAAAKLGKPLKAALSAAAGAEAGKTGGFWNHFSTDGANELAPVITPLTGSLLQGGRALTLIEKELGRFFMMPAQAGSIPVQSGLLMAAKKAAKAKKETKTPPLQPGGPVAVQLVRGDVDLSGSGTVTAVKGSKALAFGHPMFNFGQIEVPATAAYVHHCLASLSFSFKMSQPEEEVGALVLDRQAGIMVDMSRKAHVVPLKVHLEDKSRGLEETWNMEVLHHKLLTASLVRTAITSAVDKFSPDIEEAVIRAVYTVDIHDHKDLVLEEKVFQDKGTLSLAYSQRLSTALDALITSDFGKVRIDGVDAEISILYSYGVANISGAYLSMEEAEPGDRVDVYVYVKPPRESEQIYMTSFTVPSSAEGKTLEVEIRSGSDAVPDTVVPQDIDDVIDNLSKSYPADSIVVEVEVPAQGLSIGGKIMKNLPPSALDTLSPKAAYLGEQPEAVLDRHFIYPGMLMEGSVKLKLNVKGQDKK